MGENRYSRSILDSLELISVNNSEKMKRNTKRKQLTLTFIFSILTATLE